MRVPMPQSMERVLTLRHHFDRPVVVTVPVMRVMQMPINQIANVVTMGNRRVTTARPVDMIRVMTSACMTIGTSIWVLTGDFDFMLIHMISVGVVQMSIM